MGEIECKEVLKMLGKRKKEEITEVEENKEDVTEVVEEPSEEVADLEVPVEDTKETSEEADINSKTLAEVRAVEIIGPGIYKYSIVSNKPVWELGAVFEL